MNSVNSLRHCYYLICYGNFHLCNLQHAMLMPVLLGHLRFHLCIRQLQKEINYQFKDPQLLQVKGDKYIQMSASSIIHWYFNTICKLNIKYLCADEKSIYILILKIVGIIKI